MLNVLVGKWEWILTMLTVEVYTSSLEENYLNIVNEYQGTTRGYQFNTISSIAATHNEK